MYKISIYSVSITFHPGAKWRGKNRHLVYTGKINARGKSEWESAIGWYETEEEAKAALRSHFTMQVAMCESNYNRAKANLEKANNL